MKKKILNPTVRWKSGAASCLSPFQRLLPFHQISEPCQRPLSIANFLSPLQRLLSPCRQVLEPSSKAAPSTAAPPTARGAAVVDPSTWLSFTVPLSFDTCGGPTDDQPGFGNPSQQPQPQPSPVPSWLSSTFRGRAWQPPGWVWEHQRVAAEEQVARDLQREVDEQLNRSLQQSLGDEEKN